MQIPWLWNELQSGLRMRSHRGRKSLRYGPISLLLALLLSGTAMAENGPFVLEREGHVISLEPYAPNIFRVTISTDAVGKASKLCNYCSQMTTTRATVSALLSIVSPHSRNGWRLIFTSKYGLQSSANA